MQSGRPGIVSAIGVLQYRDFRLLYAAVLAANLGMQIQTFANILQIYELTGSPFQIGLTGLARAVPFIGLSLFGGVLADRVDRRRMLVIAQAVAAALAITLGLLTATGTLQVWHIYAVTSIGAAMMAFASPSRTAMIPNLVPREQLMKALALNSTTMQLSTILGPTIAGFAVAWSGFTATYALNALALSVTLVCLTSMYPRPIPAARRAQSTVNSIKEGLAFVRYRSIILALLGMDAAAMIFGSYRVLMPVLGERLAINSALLGILAGAPGIGSLIGAGVVMSLGNIHYRGLLVVGTIFAYCACLAMLAISPWYLLALVAAAAGLGLFDSLQSVPRNALIQSITPDELRGRVESFRQMLTGGMPALGQVYMGGVASLLGAPFAMLAGACACASIVAGVVTARSDLRAREIVGDGELPAPSRPHP